MLTPTDEKHIKLITSSNEAIAFLQQRVELRNQKKDFADDQTYAQIKTKFFFGMGEVGMDAWKQVKNLE